MDGGHTSPSLNSVPERSLAYSGASAVAFRLRQNFLSNSGSSAARGTHARVGRAPTVARGGTRPATATATHANKQANKQIAHFCDWRQSRNKLPRLDPSRRRHITIESLASTRARGAGARCGSEGLERRHGHPRIKSNNASTHARHARSMPAPATAARDANRATGIRAASKMATCARPWCPMMHCLMGRICRRGPQGRRTCSDATEGASNTRRQPRVAIAQSQQTARFPGHTQPSTHVRNALQRHVIIERRPARRRDDLHAQCATTRRAHAT